MLCAHPAKVRAVGWLLASRGSVGRDGRKGGLYVIAAVARSFHHGHMRTVLITVFDDVQSLDVTGPLEVFVGASRFRAARTRSPAYRVSVAAVGGGPVRTSSGLTIVPDADLLDAGPPHTLVVAGGAGTRAPDPKLVEWIRRTGARAKRIASVCTGAFLLADAGLLDGRRVTTHWNAAAALKRRHPRVIVDPEPIFVQDGPVWTSAGVTAGIDLALALVEEDLGREAALVVARHLVMFLRRPGSQSQFSVQLAGQVAVRPTLQDVQQWIVDHPGADLSVPALARRSNLSPRQFARAFVAEVGIPPGRYVDRTRLEAARRMLADTDDGVERIAHLCGYGTSEAMRRAFTRALGVAPAEYRKRF
jgi:transcriptional regulator GlxA family with amidase domain